jgi:pantothenate kinase
MVETKANPGTVNEERVWVKRYTKSNGEKLKANQEVRMIIQRKGSVKRGQSEVIRKLRGVVTMRRSKSNEKRGF